MVRARVSPERWERYKKAFEVWAATQESDVYFPDWVRLALDRECDRGDAKPPE